MRPPGSQGRGPHEPCSLQHRAHRCGGAWSRRPRSNSQCQPFGGTHLAQAGALACCLLALLALDLVKASLHAMGHRQPHCLVEVYAAKNVSLTEYRYTVTVLYAALPHHCSCRLVLKEREQAPQAIRGLAEYKQPAMVLVAARDLRAEELMALQAAGPHARRKLVVVHQSDEHNEYDVSWYPQVKAVFRNYHRNRQHLERMVRYLTAPHAGGKAGRPLLAAAGAGAGMALGGLHLDGADDLGVPSLVHQHHASQQQQRQAPSMPGDLNRPAEDDANVFWIPLGFGESFVASPAMMAELMLRPLLWSWTGSWGAKVERRDMVREFSAHDELLRHGVLHSYEHFKGPEALPPVKYSTLLYESKLVPMPPGIHPEQFRLYEALAAGTIPVILRVHAKEGLAHVEVLGFKALWVDSWRDAPAAMLQLLTNTTLQQELTQWQAHNSMQYARVMRTVRQMFAEAVCALPAPPSRRRRTQ